MNLNKLERRKYLIYTPTTNSNGYIENCCDDVCILEYALKNNSIIVSNDYYRNFTTHDDTNIYKGKYNNIVEKK